MNDKDKEKQSDNFADVEAELQRLFEVKPPEAMRNQTLEAVRTELRASRQPLIFRSVLAAAAAVILVVGIILLQPPKTSGNTDAHRVFVAQLVEQSLKPSNPSLPTFGTYHGLSMVDLDALLDEHEKTVLMKTPELNELLVPVNTNEPRSPINPH